MPAEDYIGLQGPEYDMDVERGKIREFARAMNAPLPRSTSKTSIRRFRRPS